MTTTPSARYSGVMVRLFRRRTTRLKTGGIRARFRLDCGHDKWLFRTPEYLELEQKAAMLPALRPDDVVYDIGAQIGTWTVFLAKRVQRGAVHAFEPQATNRRALEANIVLNRLRNVFVHPFAVSDRSGTAEFALTGQERDGCASLVPDERAVRTVRVDTLRLDDAPSRLGIPEPTALKIDCERAEGLVIAGAPSLLDNIRLVYMEFHTGLEPTGWTWERLLDHLEKAGFGIADRWTRSTQLQILFKR